MAGVVVGRVGDTEWMAEEGSRPGDSGLRVWPKADPSLVVGIGSVVAMSQGSFVFDPSWTEADDS